MFVKNLILFEVEVLSLEVEVCKFQLGDSSSNLQRSSKQVRSQTCSLSEEELLWAPHQYPKKNNPITKSYQDSKF